MPTYDYLCESCGHRFEKFQPITENPIKKCPECGQPKAKRMIGCGAGLIFKGSGFYETDYRSESYKKSAQAEKDQSSPKSDTANAKTETSNPKKDAAATDNKAVS